MSMFNRVIPFEIKSFTDPEPGSNGAGQLEGMGACYFNLDWKGDIIAPGAFDKDIEFTRKNGKLRNEHGITTGKITDAKPTADGLYVKAQILPTTAGNDQRILVKGGAVDRLSIGFQAIERDYFGEEAVKAWWQAKSYTPTDNDLIQLGRMGGARILNRIKTYEVSTTWLPVNDDARIIGIKSGAHAGLSLDDEISGVLATVGSAIERAEKVRDLRTKSGKRLSNDTLTRLNHLAGRITTLTVALETKAQDTKPETVTHIHTEYARFLQITSNA